MNGTDLCVNMLRSAACLHTNQSRSYLNHLVITSRLYVLFLHLIAELLLKIQSNPPVLLSKYFQLFRDKNRVNNAERYLGSKALHLT